MSTQLVNILGLDRDGLARLLKEHGQASFRAQQIIKWIHGRGIIDFNLMTDLSKSLREYLANHCEIKLPKIKSDSTAKDGTRKWLIEVAGGSVVETVLIPETNRNTLCISSQAGCALNCSFCSTGKQGFARNLTAAEIIGQLWIARDLSGANITNVVMMGMGEPLLNLEAVTPVLAIMRDELAYCLPRRRVTVSTSGVVPGILELIKTSDVSLALSLHAPNDDLRDTIVPLNKKYKLNQVLHACKQYTSINKRYFVTMEYVMLKGVNDKPEHARQLVKILSNIRCKINLIPFNPFPNSGYECSDVVVIDRFSKIIRDNGFVCTTRKTRGDDIDAACGQLVGQVLDKTKRSIRYRMLAQQEVIHAS